MGIGDRIKAVRGKLLQRDFAQKLGVSLGAVQHWENDDTYPKGTALKRMNEVFGVDINWLLTGNGSQILRGGTEGPVDLGLLIDTISVVEEWLERKKRRLPPEKKAKVILYLYEEYLEREEKPEIATVERLLQLVA